MATPAGSPDWSKRKVYGGIREAVGLTPMVELKRVTEGTGVRILVKMEYLNPSGSLKDRILFPMIEAAEAEGKLKPGMCLIEGTTGNTGISTAMVGAVKGYPVVIVMPDGMSEERKKTIKAYGAEIVYTEGGECDVDLVLEKVKQIKAQNPGVFWEVGQFSNLDNARAHYETTGPEIWEQTGGQVDLFVAAPGTGGTVTGTGRFLKERDSRLRVLAVEPRECAVLSGGSPGSHIIEGIGDGFIPDILDLAVLDGVVQVSSGEALEMARRLAREEGIFAGISSGCNVAACLKAVPHFPDVSCVVTVINDNGLRYLSTEFTGNAPRTPSPERNYPVDPDTPRRLRQAGLKVIT